MHCSKSINKKIFTSSLFYILKIFFLYWNSITSIPCSFPNIVWKELWRGSTGYRTKEITRSPVITKAGIVWSDQESQLYKNLVSFRESQVIESITLGNQNHRGRKCWQHSGMKGHSVTKNKHELVVQRPWWCAYIT